MSKQRGHLSVDKAKCPPCAGLICVGVCPQGILEAGKDKKPEVGDEASCNLCGICVDLCPAKAITITNPKEAKSE